MYKTISGLALNSSKIITYKNNPLQSFFSKALTINDVSNTHTLGSINKVNIIDKLGIITNSYSSSVCELLLSGNVNLFFANNVLS